tara:strand:- start:493 stop:1113 length:621 start_codon:yes stop_codon:yes gene_type:complete
VILKVVSSNLTIRQYIYKKMMNYKDKKYLSEDRWLAENLDSFNFFFVAQLKACDSADWTNLQRDLSKLNLKTRSISFKNIKNLSFFSTLSDKMKETIFQGKVILIYSDKDCIFSTQIVSSIKSMSILRSFILYSCGRILDPNSSDVVKSLEGISSPEWGYFLDQLNGSEIPNSLTLFQSSLCNTIGSQHATLLNLLEYKIKDENKF